MPEKKQQALFDILESIRAQAGRAKEENKKVTHDLPSAVSFANLAQDTNYLKIGVYGIAAGLVAAFIMGWQLFLFVEQKYDNKVDAVNTRIDTIILSPQRNPVSVVVTYPEPKNVLVSATEPLPAKPVVGKKP